MGPIFYAAAGTAIGIVLTWLFVSLPRRIGKLEVSEAVQNQQIKTIGEDVAALTKSMSGFIETQNCQQQKFLSELMQVVTKGDRRHKSRH